MELFHSRGPFLIVSSRWLHSTMVPGRKYSTAMRIDDQPRDGLQGSIGATIVGRLQATD